MKINIKVFVSLKNKTKLKIEKTSDSLLKTSIRNGSMQRILLEREQTQSSVDFNKWQKTYGISSKSYMSDNAKRMNASYNFSKMKNII